MARFARDSLGATWAAVLFDEASAYSRDLAGEFRRSFEASGGEVVGVERYTPDRAASFRTQLVGIREADPQVLYLPNAVQDDPIQVSEARALGLASRILGSDSWDLRGMARWGWGEGVVVTHQWHWDLPTPEAGAFIRRFRERFQVSPRTTAAMTYDAVKILARAASQAGSLDAEELLSRIASLDGNRGATGLISFKGGADPRRTVAISTIRNGEIVVLGMMDP